MGDNVDRKDKWIKMRKNFFITLVIVLSVFLTGCNLIDSETNSKYIISEEEKMFLQEKALKFVSSRTYTIFNDINNEYIENNFYFIEIRAASGEQFEIKFDLANKDKNGDYMMYIE